MELKKTIHVTIEGEQSDIAKDLKAVLIENHRYKQALEFASSELEYAHITGNIEQKDNLIKASLKVIDEALEQGK